MTQVICLLVIALYMGYCVHDFTQTARRMMQHSIHPEKNGLIDESEPSNIIHLNESMRIVHQTIQLVLEKYEVEQQKLSVSMQIIRLQSIDRKLSEYARRLLALREKKDKKRDTYWSI